MTWPVSLLLLASAFEFIVLFLVRGRSRSPAAGPFMAVLLISGLWTFGYALDLATDDLGEKIRLLQVRMLFLPFYTLAWLETAHRFAIGRPFLTGWTLRAALVVPVATVLLTWLPPFSHLVHGDFRVDTSGIAPVLLKTVGPWGHVYSLFNYTTGLLAIIFVLRARLHTPAERRWRNLFLTGGLLGLAADVLFVLGLSPNPGLNFAPFILPLTSVLIALALMGNRMKDLAPVARATLVEHLPLRLLVFDEDGRLVDLNRAAAVALGREAGDLAGMPADEVLAPLAPVRDFLRTAAPDSPRELTMDGRVLEARLLPIDGGGNVLSLDDITERKRGEEQLRLAKEAAEAAEAAQGRFLAMMSHEVRTPMNGMLGFAQILADTPLNEEQRECVEQIDRNGRALLVILNDVLDFSKITAGHLAVEQVPCDVAELARNTCKLFEHQAHEKGLGLDCRVAPGFPASVAADPVRIGQVLTNLLGNALKFTESGGISVDLELMPTPTGPIVAVRVHDTGAGIAPSEQERIFRPFEQADASTTRRFGGTGLGLTITRSLCELMGGSLTVSSEPGKGSTFTATFRVGAPLLSDAPASTPDRTAAAAEPMRLLVFEDNVINQRVIQALLEKQGHRVRLAADGAQGLAFLAEDTEGFDAILMDIEMPVMDGFEAVRRIRSSDHPGDRNRHIIALTAHAMAGERQRALAAGCNDFLTKPVRSEDLRAALARVPRPVRTSR